MKKLSAETERKLMRCIASASSAIYGGCDPNEGIAKAAQETGVRPGEVKLVVHAYNTGRTTRQREESDDIFTKVADFPLADTEEVLQIMYPDRVKTAGAEIEDESARAAALISELRPEPQQVLRHLMGLVEPGTTFETLVRASVSRRIVQEALDQPEAWISERLAVHRDPA